MESNYLLSCAVLYSAPPAGSCLEGIPHGSTAGMPLQVLHSKTDENRGQVSVVLDSQPLLQSKTDENRDPVQC